MDNYGQGAAMSMDERPPAHSRQQAPQENQTAPSPSRRAGAFQPREYPSADTAAPPPLRRSASNTGLGVRASTYDQSGFNGTNSTLLGTSVVSPTSPAAEPQNLAGRVLAVDRRITELHKELAAEKGRNSHLLGTVSKLEHDMSIAISAITTLKQELSHLADRNAQLERIMRVVKGDGPTTPVRPRTPPPPVPAVPASSAQARPPAPPPLPAAKAAQPVDKTTLAFLRMSLQPTAQGLGYDETRDARREHLPPPVGAPGVAKFAFTSRCGSEISVDAQERLHVLAMSNEGWALCIRMDLVEDDAPLSGEVIGLVPASYVDCPEEQALLLNDNLLLPPLTILNHILESRFSVDDLNQDSLYPDIPPEEQPLVATVRHSFQPTGPSQLALFAGQEVVVLDEGGTSGWAVVQSNIGDVGLAPLSFLEVHRPQNPKLEEYMELLAFAKAGGMSQVGKKKTRRYLWLSDDGSQVCWCEGREKSRGKLETLDTAKISGVSVKTSGSKVKGLIVQHEDGELELKPDKAIERWHEAFDLLVGLARGKWIKGESILLTCHADNALRQWVFDDSTCALAPLKERAGHRGIPSLVQFYGADGAVRERAQGYYTILETQNIEFSQGQGFLRGPWPEA
ncbi:Src3 [Carpediemonas membranifera]|uniref:Src3 n=1 Tax=Carpediemonas membranifera TaxID=201153 RepID=A0A8J6B0X2_9EUKA|nr:Src3 [Carpediemonas membranifera]|eukprot:KAG9390647.1 Src3 [Carpediemonas membranifera]